MSSRIYRAEPREQLRLEPLDGLTCAFARRSGSTHLLAPPAPQILEALWDGPATREELVHRIAARFELEGAEAIDARLAELEAAGLVSAA